MIRPFPLIYADVPKIPGCKGKCLSSCGPILASRREAEHFEKQTGKKFPDGAKMLQRSLRTGKVEMCPHLNALGRCDVYAQRPLICRLWGTVEAMRCPYGCEPERVLNESESRKLLEEAR